MDRFFRPGRPFYIKLAIGGFLLVPAAHAVIGLLITVLGGSTPPGVLALLTTAMILNTAAGLALRWTDRFLVPCLLASPIFAMVGLVLGGFGLAHPDSFFDFVTSLVVVLGPLVAFIGCTGAIVQRRRGSLRTASGIQRRLVWAGAAALVLIAGTSAILSVARRAAVDAPAGALVVETRVDEFVPSRLRAKPGDRLVIFVVNDDPFAHTFSIDALRLDEYIGPRARRLVRFVVPRHAARLEYWCAVTGHEGMTGRLDVG